MGMTEEHKNVLINNMSYLVKNLVLSDIFYAVMREGNIITEEMEDEIKSHPTKGSRISTFLDILSRRGPDAFKQFVKALVESDQHQIIKRIDPDPAPTGTDLWTIREIIESVDKNAQLIDEDYLKKRTVFRNRSHFELEYPKNDKKGRVVIINIKNFKTSSSRDGSEKDVKILERMFGLMQYDVNFYGNSEGDYKLWNKENITTFLDTEQGFMDSNGYKYFLWIIVIMSHGHERCFISSDEQQIAIDDVLLKFDGAHCKGLRSIPKEPKGGISKFEKEAALEIQGTSDIPKRVPIHEKADFFEAYCTLEGYTSWRMPSLGSWFIRTIVYVFSRFARHEDLQSMMTKVLEVVSGLKTDGDFIQQPIVHTTLKKNVYFL